MSSDRILLVTPIVPSLGGNGLAMRMAALYEAAKNLSEVDVLVVPIAGKSLTQPMCEYYQLNPPSSTLSALSWLNYPAGVSLLDSCPELPKAARVAAPLLNDLIERQISQGSYTRAIISRLYLSGLTLPLRKLLPHAQFILDIDEYDPGLLEQLASLALSDGEDARAAKMLEEANRFAKFANASLPWFDKIFCSSSREQSLIKDKCNINASVLPNVAPNNYAKKLFGNENTLLFIGNLDYMPNQDAIVLLIEKIFAKVQLKHIELTLTIVGAGGEPIKNRYSNLVGIRWLGYVENLADVYSLSSLVVLPLRAGGGSQIKLLEAFSNEKPVIASKIVAEGLEPGSAGCLKIADSVEEYCEAIDQLLSDTSEKKSMISAAKKYVEKDHSQHIFNRKFATYLKQ